MGAASLTSVGQIVDPFGAMFKGSTLGQLIGEKFMLVACLTLILWDIVQSFLDDYDLAFGRRLRIPTVVFFVSRVSTLVYFILRMIEINFAIDDIDPSRSGQVQVKSPSRIALAIIASQGYVLCKSSTNLLLYFRVTALYHENRPIVWLFRSLWVLMLLINLTTFGPIGSTLGHFEGTTSVRTVFFIPAALIELVNDTSVIVAIAMKIGVSEFLDERTKPRGWKIWKRMPIFSHKVKSPQRLTLTFLQDSDIFFIIVFFMNVATLVTFIPTIRNDMGDAFLLNLNAVIVHIMATKVHRNLMLGKPGFLPGEKTTLGLGNLTFVRNAPGTADIEGNSSSSENAAGRPRRHTSTDAPSGSTTSRLTRGSSSREDQDTYFQGEAAGAEEEEREVHPLTPVSRNMVEVRENGEQEWFVGTSLHLRGHGVERGDEEAGRKTSRLDKLV